MSVLRLLTLLSLAALLAIGARGAILKVRIDARAHLAEAASLLQRGERSGEARDRVAAGQAYVRAIGCWTPFDPAPGQAVTGLLRQVVPGLEPGPAQELIDAAVVAIDQLDCVVVPLASEREELIAARTAIGLRERLGASQSQLPASVETTAGTEGAEEAR